jgi:hypothetical protein
VPNSTATVLERLVDRPLAIAFAATCVSSMNLASATDHLLSSKVRLLTMSRIWTPKFGNGDATSWKSSIRANLTCLVSSVCSMAIGYSTTSLIFSVTSRSQQHIQQPTVHGVIESPLEATPCAASEKRCSSILQRPTGNQRVCDSPRNSNRRIW